MKKNYLFYFLLIGLLSSCVKPKEKDENQISFLHLKNGLLVLNEGLFQQNNSSLSWVDLSTNEVTENVFLQKNDRLLGDTGNEIKRYGGKIYIVVNASSTLEILDATSLKSVKQVNMQHNGIAQQPRRMAFHENKVYVSSFDGYVTIIDTTSLQITNRLEAGENPEGVAIYNSTLYVSNSGGLNFPNYDSTVYAYDLNTEEFITSYHVGANPGSIVACEDGVVYVVKRGNYDDDPSSLIKIDPSSGSVEDLELPASRLYKHENTMYITYFDEASQNSKIALFDLSTNSITNPSIINPETVTTLYGVQPLSDSTLIVLDAMGYTNTGFARFYDENGQLFRSINVGLNPNGFVYYKF